MINSLFVFIVTMFMCSCVYLTNEADNNANAQIILDDSTVQEIVKALDKKQLPKKLEELRGQRLTSLWAQASNQPDANEFTKTKMKKVIENEPDALEEFNKSKDFYLEIRNKLNDSRVEAIKHLQSFLPEQTKIQSEIVLTMYSSPYAFTWIGDDISSVVINVSAKYWKFNPEKVFNLLIHEFFHVGFLTFQQNTFSFKSQNREEIIKHIMWQTQNEGMATYVAYTAKTELTDIEDYSMLEDPVKLAELFNSLQKTIDESQSSSVDKFDKLNKKIWNIGVKDRAFYIVGGHMAKEIDKVFGRQTLIETIKKGPRNFFQVYQKLNPPKHLNLVL